MYQIRLYLHRSKVLLVKMSQNLCASCDSALPNEEDVVKCFGCNKWYHFICAGVSENTYRRMSVSKKEGWRCVKNCRQSAKTPPVTVSDKESFDIKFYFETLDKKIDSQTVIMSELKDNFVSLMQSFENLNTKVLDNCNKIISLEQKLASVSVLNQNLEKSVSDLKYQLNKLDQYNRRINLEIHGIERQNGGGKDENLMTILKKCAEKMGILFDETDVLAVHRLPVKRQDIIPGIIVQFCSKSRRDIWLENRRKITTNRDIGGNSDSRVFFNENLSRENKELLYNVKKTAKSLNFKYVWVRNGRIYAKKASESVTIKIESVHDIRKLN